MKMKTYLYATLMAIFAFTNVHGATYDKLPRRIDTIKNYKVGDRLPELTISNVINYKESILKLADFKGKLVIIDFWATWCASCLKSMPKLQAIQKLYNDKVKIISVTSEPKEVVNKFFKKTSNEELRNLDLTIVTDDRLLKQMFRHQILPHIVWIDRDGVVSSITSSKEVSIINIQTMLDAKMPDVIKQKADIRYNNKKPLLLGGLPPDLIELKYNSTMTGYVSGLPSSSAFTNAPKDGVRWIVNTNEIIQGLYKTALGKFNGYFMANNRTLLEFRDSTKVFLYWRNKDWKGLNKDSLLRNTAFCYELRVPESVSENEMFKMMHQDVDRIMKPMFGITGRLEKRKVSCLVVSRKSGENVLATKGGTSQKSSDSFGYKLTNYNFDDFLSELAWKHFGRYTTPLINETGYNGYVDMSIEGDLNNLDVVKQEFSKYGLVIELKERIIDMIIVSDGHN
ncbi:MAG: TlpA family protein disulfide reductase [Pedobacter sp.]|nr:MAG: TlpA family protein disulfide reductase [Pedobacter sp.]